MLKYRNQMCFVQMNKTKISSDHFISKIALHIFDIFRPVYMYLYSLDID